MTTVSELYDELRNSRTVIAEMLDFAWESGGYTLGTDEFERLSEIKDARDQIKRIDEIISQLYADSPISLRQG
jgi:hypothetical protein